MEIVGSERVLDLLDGLEAVFAAPHEAVTARLSSLLAPLVSHHAIASLADGCARSPLSAHGAAEITSQLRATDLARVAAETGVGVPVRRSVQLAGSERSLLAAAAATGNTRSLLVLVCVDRDEPFPGADRLVQQVWELVVANLTRRLADARPEDLSVSRAVGAERARVTAELHTEYAAVLMALLGVLRSGGLGDGAARRSATDLAASALVELRATVQQTHAVGDEPADAAFARLRDELRPIARYSAAELAFAGPDSAQPLPAQIAQAGRAVARNAVLTMLEQDAVTRIRVGWTVDRDLTVTVHDDGPGRIADRALAVLELTAQAEAVDGTVELESVPDWGTRLLARLPLALPAPTAENPLDRLNPREREVFELVAAGARNREIAAALSISANTVKFHVGNVLRKLEVETRGEAAALARGTSTAGIVELARTAARHDPRFG
jgi:DNA-binding CsgD family transcriptional regulator